MEFLDQVRNSSFKHRKNQTITDEQRQYQYVYIKMYNPFHIID